MLLRLQKERLNNSCFVPLEKEYLHLYGLDSPKLSYAKPDAIIMPINRGVEISNDISDHVILQQVEFGLAIRKAVFASMTTATLALKTSLQRGFTADYEVCVLLKFHIAML
jgi:aspartate carbamoyltransferase catalytic subunit